MRFGEPVREILVEAEAWGADLIAMTATRRHLRESVAGQTFRRGEIPVILYRPQRGRGAAEKAGRGPQGMEELIRPVGLVRRIIVRA